MPQVVFHDTLLDRHLGRHMQMLHLAATTGTRMQTEMRAAWLHALRRLACNRRDRTLFPIVLLATDLDRHALERQGALNKDDLAVGPVRHPLRLQVQRLHQQPLGRRTHRAATSNYLAGRYLAGSTGLP